MHKSLVQSIPRRFEDETIIRPLLLSNFASVNLVDDKDKKPRMVSVEQGLAVKIKN
jgi:hypothetical protein